MIIFELESGHIEDKVSVWFEVKKGKLLAKITKKRAILAISFNVFGKSLNILTILLTIVGLFWNCSLLTTRIRGQYSLN